jgi:hypothetical protein
VKETLLGLCFVVSSRGTSTQEKKKKTINTKHQQLSTKQSKAKTSDRHLHLYQPGMPQDPKYETSAGVQIMRQRIEKESRARRQWANNVTGYQFRDEVLAFPGMAPHWAPTAGAHPLTAVDDDGAASSVAGGASSTILNALSAAVAASTLNGTAGTAGAGCGGYDPAALARRGSGGRSGVASTTRRHVLDEGYNPQFKSEWRAQSEAALEVPGAVDALNGGPSSHTAGARRAQQGAVAHAARDHMALRRSEVALWTEDSHEATQGAWHRAQEAHAFGAGGSGLSPPTLAVAGRRALRVPPTAGAAPVLSTTMNCPTPHGALTEAQGLGGNVEDSMRLSAARERDGNVASPKRATIGLRSSGVRTREYSAARHAAAVERGRAVFDPPPPPAQLTLGGMAKATMAPDVQSTFDAARSRCESLDAQRMQRRLVGRSVPPTQ